MTLQTDSSTMRANKEWLERLRAEAYEQGKKFGWEKGNVHGYKKGQVNGQIRGHVTGAWMVLKALPKEERESIIQLLKLPHGPPPPRPEDEP